MGIGSARRLVRFIVFLGQNGFQNQLLGNDALKMDRKRAIGYYSPSFYAKRRFHDTLLQAPSNLQARMAELVDALGSGPSAGNGVEVRVLFRAPSKKTASAVFLFLEKPSPAALPRETEVSRFKLR